MIKFLLLSLFVSLSVSAESLLDNRDIDVIGIETVDTITIDTKKEASQRQIIDKYLFHQWKVECKNKDSSGDKHCRMRKFFSRHCPELCMVSVEMDIDFGLGIQFAFPNKPSVSGQIKVGKNKIEYFNDFIIRGPQAEKILNQFKSEKFAKIQIHKWHQPIVKYEANLSGFNEAYAELLKQYNGL